MNADLLLPTLALYAFCCILLNAFIYWINLRWRHSRQVWLDQVPTVAAKWLQENPGVKAYHGSPGHPFTPLLVIAGLLLTLTAAAVVVWGRPMLGQDVLGVVFLFLAVGGVIMTAGDAYRYLLFG